MRIYTTNATSPYEIMGALLCGRRPFLVDRANAINHSRRITSGMVYLVFDPPEHVYHVRLMDVLTRMPDSVAGLVTTCDGDTFSGKLPDPLVIGQVQRPPRPVFEYFSVVPAPRRPYHQLVNMFLTESVPPMSVYISGYTFSSEPGSRSLDELPPAPFIGNDVFTHRLPEHQSDNLLFLPPIMSFRVEYTNRLELLWEFPLTGMNPWQLLQHRSTWAVAVRFEDTRDPAILVMLGGPLPSDEGRWALRNRYLFADTLAMMSALLGYTSLDAGELALLVADWWSLAVGNYAYYLRADAARKTSALLLSDMMTRADGDVLANMVERVLRKEAFGSVFKEHDINGLRRRYAVPVLEREVVLDHIKLLGVWNLVRSQLGHVPLTKETYTEVPHAFNQPLG